MTSLLLFTFVSSLFSRASALSQLIKDAIIHVTCSPLRKPLQLQDTECYAFNKVDLNDLLREDVIRFMYALLIRQQSIKALQKAIQDTKQLLLTTNYLKIQPPQEPIEKIFLLIRGNSFHFSNKSSPEQVPALKRLANNIQYHSKDFFKNLLKILKKYPNKLLLRKKLKQIIWSQEDQDFLYAQLMILAQEEVNPCCDEKEESLDEVSFHLILIQAKRLFALQESFWNKSQELHDKFSFHDEMAKSILKAMERNAWCDFYHYVYFKRWVQWALSIYIIPHN